MSPRGRPPREVVCQRLDTQIPVTDALRQQVHDLLADMTALRHRAHARPCPSAKCRDCVSAKCVRVAFLWPTPLSSLRIPQ